MILGNHKQFLCWSRFWSWPHNKSILICQSLTLVKVCSKGVWYCSNAAVSVPITPHKWTRLILILWLSLFNFGLRGRLTRSRLLMSSGCIHSSIKMFHHQLHFSLRSQSWPPAIAVGISYNLLASSRKGQLVMKIIKRDYVGFLSFLRQKIRKTVFSGVASSRF